MPLGLQNDAHPTDAGYAKMADAWYSAISAADAKGWIQTPLPSRSMRPLPTLPFREVGHPGRAEVAHHLQDPGAEERRNRIVRLYAA
ncbi:MULTISPECIES: hypothetical protein [Streptosporangium]|uniref:SGNH hydrolase-type esterase domain-containing protein n=1 Tax=Streptosporangium brasiliense TaxID=47480 RepID=A0ABT9RK89_9ACTN|nr:hypothetical protein [Streptosporangium brasiliense]MDP9869149.1 hypothetical protein [Streptosporangium brasiliense]